uniref:Uncharacterized protein n=1 Tax=Rhizophora mucronata TaxID=61149 RepID=A0A2P2MPL2_RHIMU
MYKNRIRSRKSAPTVSISPGRALTSGSESEWSTEARVLRISLAWSSEIWSESTRAAELTRGHDANFCLSWVRVRIRVGSGKMSLGIGRSPCSKGSRLGWIRELGFGSLVDVDGGPVASAMGPERDWKEKLKLKLER